MQLRFPRFRLNPMRWAAASIALCLGALPAPAAASITNLVVFGDSLSDTGNLSSASGGLFPGPYYFSGRVSNGAVWAEHFSTALGQGSLVPSRSGGDNFAYGGARTTGTGFPDSLFVRDLDEQVSAYMPRASDATTLYVVWIGANDLLNQLEGGGGSESQYVASLVSDINRLRADGARQFMVPNLPDLSLTPRFNASPQAAAASAASIAFNTALASALNTLEAGDPSLTIYRLDIAAAFAQIVGNPAAFGLVNVTDAAAPGLEVGDSSYDTSLIVPNPHQYLFWDELHPTAAGHALLGEFAMASIPEPAGALVLSATLLFLLPRRRARAGGLRLVA